MNRTTRIGLVALGLMALSPTCSEADTIHTASGETITGREATVVDGTFVVPGAEGKGEQKFSLSDLEKVTFAPGKPIGELKTRFVRFDQPGAGRPLTLAEVQLFEGDKNVATTGKARQAMSYLDDDEMWGAQKAIDGKTGGDSRADGTTRTLSHPDPWWELELPKDAVLNKLVVWLRTDGTPTTRLAGFRVQFLSADRQVLWTKTLATAPAPKAEIQSPVHSDKLTADDLKAIEGLGQVKSARPLGAMIDAWVRDAKTTEPAVADTAAPASATTIRRGIGGFGAEAPQTPTPAPTTPTSAFPDGEWLVRFEPGGFVVGKITSWTDQGLAVEFALDQARKTITIPTAAVIEVSTKEVVTKKLKLDRSQIAAEGDTVFAKAEGNVLQPVTGAVKGIADDSLQFEFQGKVRGIKLAKVASIQRKASSPAAGTSASGILELSNSMQLAGSLKSLSNSAAVVELPWKQSLDLDKRGLTSLFVRNGRSVPLTDLEPSKVEYTPFLDRVLPYRKNESLTGSPLAIGDKKFDRGLCAHSGTKLVYELGGEFEKLRLQVGLQKDDGARGQAVVRIKGDDTVLAEKPVAGKSAVEAVDVSVAGKKTLVIEVDYGDGLDVGDHVVLGDPVLVRTAAP